MVSVALSAMAKRSFRIRQYLYFALLAVFLTTCVLSIIIIQHEDHNAPLSLPCIRNVLPNDIQRHPDDAINTITERHALPNATMQKAVIFQLERPPDSFYRINVSASDLESLDRWIPDERPDMCRNITYDLQTLGTASVIIPVYNEALSILLRTVHSILRRTPPQILSEIILVDDCSSVQNIKQSLVEYVPHLPKTKLVRNEVREGLTRSRINGATRATGDVFIFLDAHTEVNEGWLEPILEELKRRPTAVIEPTLNAVMPATLQYVRSRSDFMATWTWDLGILYTIVPDFDMKGRASQTDAFPISLLVGCAIALRKDYYDRIGGFDDGLLLWGGENTELAVRTWMCGGSVIKVPCSHIGHLFRPIPYDTTHDLFSTTYKNNMRVAEVWMDDYKEIFYAATKVHGHLAKITLNETEKISIENRKKFVDTLHCKPFEWFLQTVIPYVYVPPPDTLYLGDVMLSKQDARLKPLPDGHIRLNRELSAAYIDISLTFSISKSGHFKCNGKCIKVVKTTLLHIELCKSGADYGKWEMRDNHITVLTNENGQVITRCLQSVGHFDDSHYNGFEMIVAKGCEPANEYQMWRFRSRFDFAYTS